MKRYQPFKGRLLFRIHVNHVVGQNSRLKQSLKLFNNAHSPTTVVNGMPLQLLASLGRHVTIHT